MKIYRSSHCTSYFHCLHSVQVIERLWASSLVVKDTLGGNIHRIWSLKCTNDRFKLRISFIWEKKCIKINTHACANRPIRMYVHALAFWLKLSKLSNFHKENYELISLSAHRYQHIWVFLFFLLQTSAFSTDRERERFDCLWKSSRGDVRIEDTEGGEGGTKSLKAFKLSQGY